MCCVLAALHSLDVPAAEVRIPSWRMTETFSLPVDVACRQDFLLRPAGGKRSRLFPCTFAPVNTGQNHWGDCRSERGGRPIEDTQERQFRDLG